MTDPSNVRILFQMGLAYSAMALLGAAEAREDYSERRVRTGHSCIKYLLTHCFSSGEDPAGRTNIVLHVRTFIQATQVIGL